MTSKGITVLCVTLAATLPIGLGYGAVAFTPKSTVVKIWEGQYFEDGKKTGDQGTYKDLIERITLLGYTYKIYLDDKPDHDAGPCTRADWEQLPTDMGIFLGIGHASCGSFAVAGFVPADENDDAAAKAAAKAYMRAGNGEDGWYLGWSRAGQYYVASCKAEWLRANWSPTCNANRAIMWWCGCHTAGGVIQAGGGREAFGYSPETEVVCSIFDKDVVAVFGRMNGTLPEKEEGSSRRASRAFGGAGDGASKGGNWVNPHLRRYAPEGETTLCPAVDYPARNHVWPTGYRVAPSDRGHIYLDTHCVTFDNPPKTVKVLSPTWKQIDFTDQQGRLFIAFDITVLRSEDLERVDVRNARWSDEGGEDMLGSHITFEYSSTCATARFSISVHLQPGLVMAKKADAEGVPKLVLDGGGLRENGVAPNNHAFSWTFGRWR